MKTPVIAALLALAPLHALADTTPANVHFAPPALQFTYTIKPHALNFEQYDRTTRPIKYALQAYDCVNTIRHAAAIRPGWTWHEYDPISRNFGAHNPLAGCIGSAVVDVIGDMLSRRSATMRAALDTRAAATSASAILFTNNGGTGTP